MLAGVAIGDDGAERDAQDEVLAVAAVAVSVGAKSLKVIPMAWVQRITGTILLGLGVYTALGI